MTWTYLRYLADIIELFESFKEQGVQKNLTIVHLILAAWSISLMQFTLVVTATKTRKPPEKDEDGNEIFEDENCCSCRLFWETELWVSLKVTCWIYLMLSVLGVVNNNFTTGRSVSLSSSRINHSLQDYFSVEYIFYDKKSSCCCSSTISCLCDNYRAPKTKCFSSTWSSKKE